tara:strand:- start:666 stop:839 length:174 start_codon:yes stop_codon:yes gene_type:complete
LLDIEESKINPAVQEMKILFQQKRKKIIEVKQQQLKKVSSENDKAAKLTIKSTDMSH